MQKQSKYILFIDESGKSKLSDEGEFFLICGIIIDKDLHAALSHYMVSLKERSDIPITVNTHAFDLFENEKIKRSNCNGQERYTRMQHKKISDFFGHLSHLVQGVEAECCIEEIDIRPYKKIIEKYARKKNATTKAILKYLKRESLHDFIYEALTRKIILHFGNFLSKNDAYGEVVAESRRNDDHATLDGFINATSSRYPDNATYHNWSQCSFDRINGLTFQNKKGLSFGLELADLFAWAYFNTKHNLNRPCDSLAKQKRFNKRIEEVRKIMDRLFLKKKPETITRAKINTVAPDKVSEFIEALNKYKTPTITSGTSSGKPDEP